MLDRGQPDAVAHELLGGDEAGLLARGGLDGRERADRGGLDRARARRHHGQAAGVSGSRGQVAGALQPARPRIVDAIAARDRVLAPALVRDYHRQVVERIRAVRGEEGSGRSDAGLTGVLTDWLRSNASLGGQTAPHRSTPS